ncbi:hypothetical protein TSAR_008829 [Trichomalopsis sarcophagae]|uniref:RNA-directed DNA polymerase n=1 Tax=Trichomalopsis sarcophagae TaxID=543379 RepID=A0A232EGX8_9HYME|nr:hypothetical protein TSAR_008829 [Trichomalopsis sarcophagae]
MYCDITDCIVRLHIPEKLRQAAVDTVHGLLHPSGRGTMRTLKSKYSWPAIKKASLKWTKECIECQRVKKDCTALTTATAIFNNCISHYSSPLICTSDQGPQFRATIFKAFTRFLSSHKTRTSPYHPASNGIIERWHDMLP